MLGRITFLYQALYDGDHVQCVVNGVATEDVYLGRGLRQVTTVVTADGNGELDGFGIVEQVISIV